MDAFQLLQPKCCPWSFVGPVHCGVGMTRCDVKDLESSGHISFPGDLGGEVGRRDSMGHHHRGGGLSCCPPTGLHLHVQCRYWQPSLLTATIALLGTMQCAAEFWGRPQSSCFSIPWKQLWVCGPRPPTAGRASIGSSAGQLHQVSWQRCS